jgi:hypothetical protein
VVLSAVQNRTSGPYLAAIDRIIISLTTGGAAGSGYQSCSPSAAIAALASQYTTGGPGVLACDEGTDVPYPPGAPGYAYDPTGSSNQTVCLS